MSQKTRITLIKRSRPNCPSCSIMAAQLSGEGLEYSVIDVTEQPGIIETLGLTSVPVLLIEREDGTLDRLNGVQPIDKILALMNE